MYLLDNNVCISSKSLDDCMNISIHTTLIAKGITYPKSNKCKNASDILLFSY